MKPGSRYPPRASITVSCDSAATSPTAAILPSRTDALPSTIDSRSSMVRMVALRTRRAGSGRSATLDLAADIETLHRERGRIDAAADGDELGQDADRDFGRGDGADVEADRRVYSRQAFGRHALFQQQVVDSADLRAAADQPQVAQLASGEGAHGLEIVRVPAGDHDNERRLRQLRAVQPVRDRLGDHFVGSREAVLVGELLAVVHYMDAEAGVGCEFPQLPPDVAGADNVKVGGRL